MNNNNLLVNVLRCAKNEAAYAYFGFRSKFGSDAKNLNGMEQNCIQQMNQHSAFVIENYWSREKSFSVRDQLAAFHDKDEPYVLGDSSKDELVRIYHVERIIPELKEFRFDPFVLKIANAYNGFPSYSGALVYQHDTVHGREKSHYHVDTFRKQFKAMMYLDDVNIGNGPFSYIPGSHLMRNFFIKKQISGNKNKKNNVFDDTEVSSMLSIEKQVCVPAGSLLMFDTGCIHRGAPQEEGSRSVLMNYIVPNQRELYLNKDIPPL
jgi:hypothetical protein